MSWEKILSEIFVGCCLANGKKNEEEGYEVIITRRIATTVILLALLSGAGVCSAGSAIPDLVGTWIVEAEGALLLAGKDPAPKVHHAGEFSMLTAEAVVTKQQGRVLHGIFKSPKATENFVAVIGMDGRSFYFADEDGTLQGTIVSEDKIEVVYHHVSRTETVIAVGTWTRKK